MNLTEISGNPEEAALIQNMEMGKDGIWRPRAGLVSRTLFSGDCQHVSDHPNRTHVMVVEGGRLQYVNSSGWAATQLATGWTSSGYYKSATGIASGTAPPDWCIASAPTTDTAAQLYKVNSTGTLAAMSTATGNWVEAYGQYVFAVKPGSLTWSAAEDITTWSGTNIEPPNPAIGICFAFVAISDDQALVLGEKGCSLWHGSDSFGQQQLYNLRGIPYGLHAVRCGDGVLFASPGPQILRFLGANNHQRMDLAVQPALRAIANWDLVYCWFDEFRYQYVLSDTGTSVATYVLDLDSGAWIAKNLFKNGAGTNMACIGQASLPDSSGGHGRRFVGVGKRLCELDYSVYTDNGDAIECVIETPPDDRGLPHIQKVLERIYIQGGGSWTVSLLYRTRPGESWTTLAAQNTVSGPGWAYFDPTAYMERKIRIVGTAASTLDLSRLVVHETLAQVAA